MQNTTISKKPIPLFIVTLVALALVVGSVVVSASLSTTGTKLRDLELQKASLVEQNQELEQHILEKSSLLLLEEKAEDLGFTRPDEIITITPASSVALSTQH